MLAPRALGVSRQTTSVTCPSAMGRMRPSTHNTVSNESWPKFDGRVPENLLLFSHLAHPEKQYQSHALLTCPSAMGCSQLLTAVSTARAGPSLMAECLRTCCCAGSWAHQDSGKMVKKKPPHTTFYNEMRRTTHSCVSNERWPKLDGRVPENLL